MNATTTLDRPATDRPTASAPGLSPIPFRTLFRVEWGKATDTRAARWLLAITAAATILIMLAPLLATGSIDQTYRGYLDFVGLPLTLLLPIVAILTMTTEWTQRTVLTTFTQEPRRVRVIEAKCAVSAVMSLIATVYGAVVMAAALGVAAATGRDLSVHVTGVEVIGFVLFVLASVFTGVAFGALLHNSAAAIVASLVLPTVVGLLGAAVPFIDRWFDPSRTFGWMGAGEFHGHVGPILASALVWVALPLAGGLWRTMHREIK